LRSRRPALPLPQGALRHGVGSEAPGDVGVSSGGEHLGRNGRFLRISRPTLLSGGLSAGSRRGRLGLVRRPGGGRRVRDRWRRPRRLRGIRGRRCLPAARLRCVRARLTALAGRSRLCSGCVFLPLIGPRRGLGHLRRRLRLLVEWGRALGPPGSPARLAFEGTRRGGRCLGGGPWLRRVRLLALSSRTRSFSFALYVAQLARVEVALGRRL
jgi:hypothetical protein